MPAPASDALLQQALAAFQTGHLDTARNLYQQVLAAEPAHPGALHMLGVIALHTGDLDRATQLIRAALAIKPDFASAWCNLGTALLPRSPAESAAACRRAIALRPDFAEAHNNLGNALVKLAHLDDAIAAFRSALALRPDYWEAMNNLAGVLADTAQLDDALALWRRALALRPDHALMHGALLYSLHFHPASTPQSLLAEHQLWNTRFATPLLDGPRSFINAHDPAEENFPQAGPRGLYAEVRVRPPTTSADHASAPAPDPAPGPGARPLRIGYVSPDFRAHAVALCLLPLLRHHDHTHFHITCYSNTAAPDHVTAQFQQAADQWRSIVGLSDDAAAALVRSDQIDILVDLALHTQGNRLLLFARKPAPIQFTFAGYPGTTGLSAIDYRITDPYLDPQGESDANYTERSLRLPDSFWLYDPTVGCDASDIPPVSPPPFLTNHFITFGCLNKFSKLNPRTLALWAPALRALPTSRLLLLAPPDSARTVDANPRPDLCTQRSGSNQAAAPSSARAALLKKMDDLGIAPHRIDFVPHQPRPGYLATYHQIDLTLDTFPYHGHMTTLDSLFMAVPVISLLGQTPISRAARSILSHVGLANLATDSDAAFTTTTLTLATNPTELATLRTTLRERLLASPLTDAPRFARSLESLYRQAWARYCGAQ